MDRVFLAFDVQVAFGDAGQLDDQDEVVPLLGC